MKQCPRCNKTYSDELLNFCLDCGELLTIVPATPGRYIDDPPTMVIDQARITNPVSWPQSSPPPAQTYPRAAPAQMYGAGHNASYSPNQTLAVISLCLGIGSVTIGWCCSSGIFLAPAAMITGFIAMQKHKNDPQNYGGRGLAIAGIVCGVIYLALLIVFFVIYGLAVIGSGLAGM